MDGLIRRGSSMALNIQHSRSASLMDAGKQQQLRWSQLARLFWRHYIALAALAVLLIISETLEPFQHVLYSTSDNEIWKYSYPMKSNRVKPWMVPTIALSVPLAFIVAWYTTGKITPLEAHHATMAAFTCVLTTGITTNFIKVHVGRFRPNFVARCWPNGAVPHFELDGRPACNDGAVDPAEGMKSFPSGHTAWSTAGLGFTSFWLMGKLQCFVEGGPGAPFKFIGSLLPLSGAVYIGASRLQDYWHHVEDVAVGFLLGLTMAYCFYRTVYAGIMSSQAGCLVAGTTMPASGWRRGGSSSEGNGIDSAEDRV